MLFLDRKLELEQLERLGATGGLGVVTGRRRIGKTRLLVEWIGRTSGVYTVSDESSAAVQRAYTARALAARFPGFADVDYPSWQSLFDRIAAESRHCGWRGPLALDELPYAVRAAPELPSILQRFIDHELPGLGMSLVVAGSSQRMMQGLVLDAASPLYGRAKEMVDLGPLPIRHMNRAFGRASLRETVERYTAWGGVPRYWELAVRHGGDLKSAVHDLVLAPSGVLHKEPDRLLLEELPPAVEVRPVLDAVGFGAHRVSEIAGRIARPATSLSRPLERLLELGLLSRDVPFGEPPRRSRRTLYRIRDPFTRLWFRVVAANRGVLALGTPAFRRALLDRFWPALCASAWEELARDHVSTLTKSCRAASGSWGPAGRWWRGNLPEWDLVARDVEGSRLLLGEAKWSAEPFTKAEIDWLCRQVASRPAPELPGDTAREVVRCIFVPEPPPRVRSLHGVQVVSGRRLIL